MTRQGAVWGGQRPSLKYPGAKRDGLWGYGPKIRGWAGLSPQEGKSRPTSLAIKSPCFGRWELAKLKGGALFSAVITQPDSS